MLSYIHGENEVAPKSTHKDFMAWELATSIVLCYLASCVHDQMLGYIRNAKMPKKAWDNLNKFFAEGTMIYKLQLCQKLNNIQ